MAINHTLIKSATLLALLAAVISGTNNFVTKIAVTAVGDPIFFTTLKNAIVALGLIGVIIAWRKWPEIAALSREQWIKLFAIGVIGGAVPFALFFTGLTKTSALNAGLIHKTLFIWVMIFAIPILKERVTRLQWLGIGTIFAANLFVGGFAGFKYNAGELMILGATILWAIENIIAKTALKDIPSATVASARMVIGSVILSGLVLWQGNGGLIMNLNAMQWGWTILTSLLLGGYVLAWYTALKYAPATYVAALLVPATLVTNALSAIFITRTMALPQLASSALFILGTVLVIAAAAYATRTAPSNELRPKTSA
ncbi:MAG: hypothetical protein UY71_C0023G0023 [Parcubacteria group bacterium GW2011_GWB1_52_7]|nr:MAG: hypothetical protein UY64_C0001G0017 [Parcubacteria group bacterium GW2011_GWA1_51_12]KKW28402.1 MAG: hypothetical protein UY71_C0023G0023 [Parcubacteria group bacterium GW2011_GWB1_52_7]